MDNKVEPSDNEPSMPSIPPRGRARYPATASRELPDRVPLHRRGTSRTYERLEDLLKEAGYKETKIYTPETDKSESLVKGDGDRRGGMSAVVDFISGWIPGGGSQQSDLDPHTAEPRDRTPSPSPQPRRPLNYTGESSGRGLRLRPSATESLRAYAQRAAMQGQLRHMVSAPNMAKRYPANDRKLSSSRSHDTPPMPPNWLDTVARAVVGSSASGVHVGGPSSRRPSSRVTPSSPSIGIKSIPILKDRTNRVQPLTTYLCPKTATSALNTCNVVCRSAPASRSSSRTRDNQPLHLDKGKQRDTRPGRGKKPPKSTGSVPTLAATQLENDVWGTQWLHGRRVSATPSDSPDDYESDEDDEDGELNLARILVDPKRQNSIHSLRQHLHRSESARALRDRHSLHREPWMSDDDGDIPTGRKNKQQHNRRTSIEEGGGYLWGEVPGFDSSSRKRRGVPGTWSTRTGRS